MEGKKERIAYFDNLRAILIFLVVFGHFCEISMPYSDHAKVVRYVIYVFHMPLFVFVSGLFNRNNDTKRCVSRAFGFYAIYVMMKIVSLACRGILNKDFVFSLFSEGGIPWFMFALGTWTIISYLTRRIRRLPLLAASILLSLVAGYDSSIGMVMTASRIMVFWPFFLLGECIDREKIVRYASKKHLKVLGVAFFMVLSGVVVLAFDKILFAKPMLSGQNAYVSMGQEHLSHAFLVRLLVYVGALVFSVSVMLLTPVRKLPFSYIGQRTLIIYFLNLPMYYISAKYFPDLAVWQYFLISLVEVYVTGIGRLNELLSGLTNCLSLPS